MIERSGGGLGREEKGVGGEGGRRQEAMGTRQRSEFPLPVCHPPVSPFTEGALDLSVPIPRRK